MPKIELLNIDCMEYMATLPDKAFDLAIVDPPYGIGFDGENETMTLGLRKDGTQRHDPTWKSKGKKIKYERKNWDKEKPPDEYFFELMRSAKNLIIWGGNYFTNILPPSGAWVVWDKKVPKGFSLSDCEMAWRSWGGSVKIFRYMWSGYLKERPETRQHPTQKPVALYRWLLHNYASPGDRILDTHLGSGSIALACHDFNFDLTGCEIDKDYYDAAVKRLKNHQSQLKLFA